MKTLPVTEAKTLLPSLLNEVVLGNEVAISYDNEKDAVAILIPYTMWKKTKKRELGTLRSRAEVLFSEQFSITDEELISL